MNRPLRVLLVGRRFWPHGSFDAAGYLSQLAAGLHRRGVHVEVMTPRYASSWPELMQLREVTVHRPAAAPRSDWSMGRYVRHITTWMRDHGGSFDVLFADAMREESTAVLDAAKSLGLAAVLRHSGHGDQADSQWWESSRAARRCSAHARSADRIVAPTALAHRALLSAGFPASNIVRIDNGFSPGKTWSASARQAARRALATANSDLSVSHDSPVVACIGRMTREGGMHTLVQSSHALVARYPNVRIWFLGDGPSRDSMYMELKAEGVRASIAMPGTFADLEDVLAAADVLVQCDPAGLDHVLTSAISAELPAVVIDHPATRTLMGSVADPLAGAGLRAGVDPGASAKSAGSLVHWYAGSSAKSLRVALRHVLDDLPAHRQHAAQLRRICVRAQPQSDTIDAYVDLFTQVAQQHRSRNGDTSIEAAS